MIDIANGEEFSRLIEKLARDVGSASIHWKLYRDVHAAIGKNKAIWNQAPTFWHPTTNAHIFTAIQALSRVYDQNDKALHLRSWLQTIEANLPLFKVEMFRERLAGNAFVDSLALYPRIPDIFTLKADLLLCSASNPDVKLLLVHRNNIASHRNARAVAYGEEIGALEVEVLERLLEKAILIVNRYSNLFSANSYSATMIGQDDYRSVLSAIASAIERRNVAPEA